MAAALMHLAERAVQPDKFGTIPVGYGDAVPITPIGRVLAGFTIFADFGRNETSLR
jgi:voltage-gated potassium channel